MSLHRLVATTAATMPNRVAVHDARGGITYRELDALANRCARALVEKGVRRGDRVAIWLPKSVAAIVAMQAALRIGAAYVPCDPTSPVARVKTVCEDCDVRVLVTTPEWAATYESCAAQKIEYLATRGLDVTECWPELHPFSNEPLPDPGVTPADLAYILYTSGSTGRPKGVCISGRAALAFIEWAAHEIAAAPEDRFASHAPFHFDLSVLDLYVPFLRGASVALVPEGAEYAPRQLVQFIERANITVWYSVPTALILMLEHGGLTETTGHAPRIVLFAGEPFPIKHLRRLRNIWRQARFLNLYGPTETNVCTYFEVGDIPDDRITPIPIGRASCGDRVWAIKPDGSEALVGESGELLVWGPTVMLGYWGREPQGDRPYATGDLVQRLDADNYLYLGRLDQMVKVRGHRIELGEIEAALMTRDDVREAAVVVHGDGPEATLVAFVAFTGEPASLLRIKHHCAERLPRYMIIDELRTVVGLPRSRTGKIDRAELRNLVRGAKTSEV
ncbi:MAG TPA: amino acid adenylation domain-containing protein [Kofleriaceae bacterium]